MLEHHVSGRLFFLNVNECEYQRFRRYICSQSLKRAAEPQPIPRAGGELVATGTESGEWHMHTSSFLPKSLS